MGGKGKIYIVKNLKRAAISGYVTGPLYFMNGNLRSMAVWMGAKTSKGGRGRRNRQEIGRSIIPDKNAMLRRLHDWHCRRHHKLRVETFLKYHKVTKTIRRVFNIKRK